MYWLRTTQKVLFICNLCWIASLIFRVISLDHWPDVVVKTIVVLGEIIALPLGLVWYGIWFIILLSKKVLLTGLPRWLLVSNLCFLLVIVFYRIM